MRNTLLRSAVFVALATAAYGAEPFRDLSYKEAMAAAEKEGKVVLVQVGATWSTACQKLDKATWTDEGVRKLLKEKTIAIKIDGDKETAFCQERHIHLYPTFLFLKPDGTNIDRILGFRDAKAFLKEANDALAGRGNLARALERIPDEKYLDPSERSHYADELARKGQYKEAAEEYIWCFDYGLLYSDSFSGVRVSFLLCKFSLPFGMPYPAGVVLLKERRDVLSQLLADAMKALDEGKPVNLEDGTIINALSDAKALTRELSGDEANLALYETLKKRGRKTARMRELMLSDLQELFVDRKRYADIIESTPDVMEEIRSKQEILDSAKKYAAGTEDADDVIVSSIELVRDECGIYFEAALGVGETKLAKEISRELLRMDGSGDAYAALIKHAVRAENYKAARWLVKKGQEDTRLTVRERSIVKKAARKIPKDSSSKSNDAKKPKKSKKTKSDKKSKQS